MIVAPRLETERLVLRAHRIEDFERLAELYEQPRSKFIGGPLPRAQVWTNFAADIGHWVLLGFGVWAVELRESGTYVGQVGLTHPDNYPEGELGWLLWEEFEGKGYAFEAAMRAREFAFSTLDWKALVSYIDPDNLKSIRLAERMGAALDRKAKTPNNDPTLVYRHPFKNITDPVT